MAALQDAERLRAQASMCRRMARLAQDSIADELQALAAEYDAEADCLDEG